MLLQQSAVSPQVTGKHRKELLRFNTLAPAESYRQGVTPCPLHAALSRAFSLHLQSHQGLLGSKGEFGGRHRVSTDKIIILAVCYPVYSAGINTHFQQLTVFQRLDREIFTLSKLPNVSIELHSLSISLPYSLLLCLPVICYYIP